MDGHFSQSERFILIILVLAILPLMVMIFNEFIFRARKNEHGLIPPIKLLRNFILPLIAVFIIVNQLMEVSRDTFAVKVIETLIYILILNAILAIINVVFFSNRDQSLMKTKVPQLFLDIFRVVLVLLGTAIIFSAVWGADLGSMVTALGVGSFVLGLALQDTLGNLFSGVALLYEKPFKVGENIQIDDWYGEVIELNWRATRIMTEENIMVVIPHLIAGASTIQNFSYPSKTHIIDKTIGMSRDVPPNKIKAFLMQTMLAIPGVLKDPNPVVETVEYTDYLVKYKVTFGVENFECRDDVMNEFMTQLWYVSQRHDLQLHIPQSPMHYPVMTTNTTENIDSKDELIETELNELAKLIPINKNQIPLLKKGTRRLFFGLGEFIVKQGDTAGELFILKSGIVKMIIGDDETAQERFLLAGDFFGEITTMINRKYSFSIQVVEDIEVLVIAQAQVVEMIENNPKLAFYLDSDIHLGVPQVAATMSEF